MRQEVTLQLHSVSFLFIYKTQSSHLSLLLHFDALQELPSLDACVLLARLKDGQRLVEQEVGDNEPVKGERATRLEIRCGLFETLEHMMNEAELHEFDLQGSEQLHLLKFSHTHKHLHTHLRSASLGSVRGLPLTGTMRALKRSTLFQFSM